MTNTGNSRNRKKKTTHGIKPNILGRNTYVTKSGKTIKLNRSLSSKYHGAREGWLEHKAARLAGSPKAHLKRFFYRLRPKNLYHYWFSREGAIMLLKLFGIGIVTFSISTVGAFAYLRKDLPQINNINGQSEGGSISFYDRTGTVLLWQDYDSVKRVTVPDSQISPYMAQATVAIEDKNFYHEGALDVGAVLRSAYHDVFESSESVEGASTITEQLVKLNENWNGQRSVFTKVKEIILASELEREYSKQDILGAYLNIAPYGGVDYGVQTAAEDYFGENASQLTLAQSAFLAAIPQSPSYYSPWSQTFSEPALIDRSDYILSEMQKQGYISKAEEVAAAKVDVVSEVQPQSGKYSNIIAPYFVLTAEQQLENQFGTSAVQHGGMKVITTLSVPQQDEAQNLVTQNLSNVVSDGGDDEALVVENVPSGQVTALVGGPDFYNTTYGQINYATTPINPGSSYKLYDYTALINDNNNVGSGSVIYDNKEPLSGYPCTNTAVPNGNCVYDYDYQYPGPLPLSYALAGSRNVPAVKAMLITGESKTINLSEQMGLTSGYTCYANNAETITEPCYSSAAIGYGYLQLDQSVNGYATDARLGNYVPETFILSVTSAGGNTVYQWQQPKADQVIRPDAAYIVDSMLDDPGASYLPGSCSATNCTPISDFGWKFQHTNGWDVAVKTGTTNSDDSGLMMAMTTQYSVGSWVGYYTATQALIPHYGGLEGLTEPLTRGMITYLTQGQTPVNWQAPPGIKTLPAYQVSSPTAQVMGYYYGWQYPSPSTGLYPSWYTGPIKASTPTCDVNVFSIDIFASASSSPGSYPNCGSSGIVTTPAPTITAPTAPSVVATDPSIVINNVGCDPDDAKGNTFDCNFTITATQGSNPLSTNTNSGTISIFNGGQDVGVVDIAPGGSSPYTSTITVDGLSFGPDGDTFTAQVSDSSSDIGTSAPFTVQE